MLKEILEKSIVESKDFAEVNFFIETSRSNSDYENAIVEATQSYFEGNLSSELGLVEDTADMMYDIDKKYDGWGICFSDLEVDIYEKRYKRVFTGYEVEATADLVLLDADNNVIAKGEKEILNYDKRFKKIVKYAFDYFENPSEWESYVIDTAQA